MLLLITGTSASQSYPLSRDDAAIRSAVNYLLSCQNEDGGFNNRPDITTSNLIVTANTAMALALSGDIGRATKGEKTPLDYLLENPPDENTNGGKLGRYVMGLVASGGDPYNVGGVDFVERLKECAKPPYGEENLFAESYILLGLAAVGEERSSEVQAFVTYLKSKQYDSSGWGWGDAGPDLDTTGIAACALLAAGEPPTSESISNAISYMRGKQNEDGGFPSSGMSADSNAISDAWVMLALNAAVQDPSDWKKVTNTPISHLLSCQQEDGVFWWMPDSQGAVGYLAEETSYSIIALMGEKLPIKAPTPEAAEGAAVTIQVLGDGSPIFSGGVEVGTEGFVKDGFEIRNPTVLGALQETGIGYALGDPSNRGYPCVFDLAGFGMALYFVDGSLQMGPVGEHDLKGDECILVSAPDTVLPLRMEAPGEVITGDGFTIEVYSEGLDDEGNIVTSLVEGAIVTLESTHFSAIYATDADGVTPEIKLSEAGEYDVKAEKGGFISTFYLNCGHHVINCLSGEPVVATIHVLGNGAPLFSGNVQVQTADFNKDEFVIENPTAMGALDMTGIGYSLSEWDWGLFVSDVAGYGAPNFYVNGAQAPVGLDQYRLGGGECIVVSAPWSASPLYLKSPSDAVVGEPFKIKVESEEYDSSWNLVRAPVQGATVTVGTSVYSTEADGFTPDIELDQAGEYEVRADKPGYIGTFYLNCGPHIISCQRAEHTDVTIHVLGNGGELFSKMVSVSSVGFTMNGFSIDNPTAMGALDRTGVLYSLSQWDWGLFVSDVAGYGSPSFYLDGELSPVGLDQSYLNGEEWITVSAPYTVSPLYLDAPSGCLVGEAFNVLVKTEVYDANWNLIMVPVAGAKVIIENDPNSPYTTNSLGIASITLHDTGKYNVKVEKDGYIGTYYLIPGGYRVIDCTGKSGILSVTKTADRSSAQPSEIITYIISISNNDTSAVTEVNATDLLLMDSTFIYSDPWPDEIKGNEIRWRFPEIPPGGRKNITLNVKVSETMASGYALVNCVEVAALNATKVPIPHAVDCDEVFIGIATPLVVTKIVDKSSAKGEDQLKYTIKICNNDNSPMTDVAVRDVFSKQVKFISAVPSPIQELEVEERFEELVWSFSSIQPGRCEEIVLVVDLPAVEDFIFGMEQRVVGEGYVFVANDYSTAPPDYILTNDVIASAINGSGKMVKAFGNAFVRVSEHGTELKAREHGSGRYESEDLVNVESEHKSIEIAKIASATYGNSTFNLYNNRTLNYLSRWTEEWRGKNHITGTSIHECYRYANSIDRNSYINLDDKSASIKADSQFEGMCHFGILQKTGSGKGSAGFESNEDYAGSFRIYQVANGTSLKYNKSASGEGFVTTDRRINDCQRSYESGSGIYESDELIEAQTKYIAKDINLSAKQTSLEIGDGIFINNTMKWGEGTWFREVRKNSTTFIGEEFSSLDRLNKQTIARGFGDLTTDADFSGMAKFRAIFTNTTKDYSNSTSLEAPMGQLRDPTIDLEDGYLGEYTIHRRVMFSGGYKYGWPHIHAEKSGEIIYGSDKAFARYNISLENDGNRALGPIVAMDLFPPGAVFVNSSESPSTLMPDSLGWTFVSLPIGGKVTMELWLDVTNCRVDELVNRIEASGSYNGNVTTTSAFSAIEINWLQFAQASELTATKNGELDQNDPRVIVFTLKIQNLGEREMVARVTDSLPEGMTLLDSSVNPASIDGDVITWNLIDIGPYEAKTIVYKAEAVRSGEFLNRALIESWSLDGSRLSPIYANAIVEIPTFEGEHPAKGWQPPDWDLQYDEYSNNVTCEEICNQTEIDWGGG
ncbi:MAG: DUF11 domain-containing protein [Methanotrichaceae archaeon]|nr:DUF11 domain-containing protein [Methanotrichaceae archaeon]